MSGLVGYDSSDEDIKVPPNPSVADPPTQILSPEFSRGDDEGESSKVLLDASREDLDNDDSTDGMQEIARNRTVGPQLLAKTESEEQHAHSDLSSPTSAYRAAIHDLTLPRAPNLNIPPSPPNSPSPEMERRFEHFLQLKRQGVHFNEKLAASSSLKNPGLFPKLMASAGLTDIDQYANALPRSCWDPSAFPPWAYKEELAKNQHELALKKEEERSHSKRDSIEFVPAVAKKLSDDEEAAHRHPKPDKLSSALQE